MGQAFDKTHRTTSNKRSCNHRSLCCNLLVITSLEHDWPAGDSTEEIGLLAGAPTPWRSRTKTRCGVSVPDSAVGTMAHSPEVFEG